MTDTEQKRIKAICKVAHIDDIGDLSDGYHTFRQLYYQRMMLFAALVKQNRDKAWKSLRHEDGELCFGGGWFIVGIDTPKGSYTYHYEDSYFSLFDCVELERGKTWDGHTEKDVTRLLSLDQELSGDAIDRKLVCAFIAGLISDDGEREKGLEYIRNMPPVNSQSCEDAISRQVVLEQIDQWAIGNREYLPTNAMHYLTRRIQDIPPVNPQPCEDAINREDALMCLTGEIKETDTIETIIARFVRRIRKLSPVNPTNIGHWIDTGSGQMCSRCGEIQYGYDNFRRFCASCGAKMVDLHKSEE